MSVQAVAYVLAHAQAQGAERLVLVAIANHAGALTDAGDFEAWPGIEVIAEEGGFDNVRTVKNAVTRLVRTGELDRVVNGAPDGRIARNLRPNLYRIHTRPRSFAKQVGHRFAEDDVVRHPLFAGAEPLTPPDHRPQPAQVWVVDAVLHRRVGDPDRVSPDDELVHLERSEPVDNPASTGVSSDDLGVSPNDIPSREGCRETTARGVVSRREGVSSDDAKGCRLTTPKPSVNRHEPSLNQEREVGFSARDLTSDIHSGPPAARTPAEARQRLTDLLNRRTDRPTATTGLRTGREALTAARSRVTETPGAADQ